MIFFFILLFLQFAALVVQHSIPELPMIGCRLLLMQIIMLYAAIALPLPGMLAATFLGGFMWDALHVQMVGDAYEISLGWTIALYTLLGAIMAGFRPMFLRGRWEIHCLLTGFLVCLMVLAEYVVISIRREPVQFIFDRDVAWRIGGAGLSATLLSPLVFFVLNYVAVLTGYDPQPERHAKTKRR
jgi:hypothetical protein